QQWYTDQNVTVADGKLTITAKNESVAAGFPYTSSRINTKGKLDFKYGRVEASIKAPAGQGLWSAFWMLSSDSPYGDTWAATGEIDIFEAINPTTGTDLDFTGGTIYHGFPSPWQQFLNTRYDVDATAGFNRYAVEWEQNEIRFFYNDTHVSTITSESYYSYYYDEAAQGYTLAPDGAPFDQEFHILLNLAIGGNATGNEINDDAIGDGADMEVEYVRVYQCSYGLADGSGCNSNADRTLDTPAALRPGTAAYDIYTDGPATYEWTVAGETFVRPLALATFFDNDGALMLAEIADPNGGTMIDVNTTGGGNFSIYSDDGEGFELFEMENAAEIRFNLYIDSANTDADGTFQVKMDSGFPALGFKEFSVADLPQDEWTTISVKVNDLLANPGDSPLDLSNVLTMFVFEPGFTTAMHAWIDDITLTCASPGGCGIRPPVPEAPPITGPFRLEGTWRMSPEAGSLGVGPVLGDVSWFAIDDAGVSARACYFDDDYVFGLDGSFQNVLGDETWLEQWQSGVPEACGTPVLPHDGSSMDYTFNYVDDGSTGTLTLNGTGAYIGLPKAVNAGELPAVTTPSSVVYNVVETSNSTMTVYIEAGAGIIWQYQLIKTVDAPGGGGADLPPFAGTWQVTPVAGSLGVGPMRGDITWWSIDDGGVTSRSCFYDDEYIMGVDGSFQNVLGADTWLETWQGIAAEGCGAPVAPHDGTATDYTYTYDEGAGTLTLNGPGAYMGIPKAVNDGELGNPDNPGTVQATTTYLAEFTDANNVVLDIESGTGVWWRFLMTKTVQPVAPTESPVSGTWVVAPEAGSLGVGPMQGDITWWSIDDGGVTSRSCFYDDTYVLGTDGSFQNVLGADTWLETWQGIAAEGCGAPVAPHDGTATDYTYTYDEGAGTLTLNGPGAYLGIPKAVNDGELGNPDNPGTVQASTTYIVDMPDTSTMIVDIESGTGVWWRFKMVKQ
ncbi:MAG: glycoside hydrolase family 16 protein, partial [Enterobacterales bacterium]|nr:glycoside hydrolase family 16 protein [Enterobacterales bacterium]